MKVILFFVVLTQAALMTAAVFIVASHVGRIEGWLSHQGYPYRLVDEVEVTYGPFKGRHGIVMVTPAIGVQLSDANGFADGPIQAFNVGDLTPIIRSMPMPIGNGGAVLDTGTSRQSSTIIDTGKTGETK